MIGRSDRRRSILARRAAGTAQNAQQRNMRPERCQTSDKMELASPIAAPSAQRRLAAPEERTVRVLRFLSIRNLAVIDRLELEFEPGLGVLTGETGAGKSILVGAVGLLAGGRASADLVRTGEELATVEAIFESRTVDELIVRREISAQGGRSRAFVDGALDDIGGASRPRRTARRSARPARASGAARPVGAPRPARRVRRTHRRARARSPRRLPRWQRLKAERDALLTGEREKAARAEFLTFQLQEIDRVGSARRAKTMSSPRCGRCWPTPTSCSGCAPMRTRRSTKETRRHCRRSATVWRRLGELAGIDDRVPPVRRRAGRGQSPARGPGVLPAVVRGRDRRLAGAASGSRGPTCGARASETKARAVARRGAREGGAASAGELDDIEHATERAATLDGAVAAARDAYRGLAEALSEATPPGRRAIQPRARASRWRSWRCPARAATSGSRPIGARLPGPTVASTPPSSSSRRMLVRTCGRLRGLPRAASCRESCWR